MSLFEFENSNYAFCVTHNGVVESYRFLALLSWRHSHKQNNSSGTQMMSHRSRTSSLPPSFTDFPTGKSESCSRLYSPEHTLPRSMSSEYVFELKTSARQDFSGIEGAKQGKKLGLDQSVDKEKLTAIQKSQNSNNTINRPRRKQGRNIPTKSIVNRQNKEFSLGNHRLGTFFYMDGYMLSYFVSELKRSQMLRRSFMKRWGGQLSPIKSQSSFPAADVLIFVAMMTEPENEILDRLGNKMVNSNILYRRSLEHALSWLSTLGGAFSALGDLSPTYAEEAGHVSITQLRIAMKLGDPGIQSRCRLYAAISLLQRGYLKSCRDIVKMEFRYAASLPEGGDPRLRRMCLGIWAKLQYHWKLVASSDKKFLKSTIDGLTDIKNNSKYRNVYDLEEGRKVAPFEDCTT